MQTNRKRAQPASQERVNERSNVQRILTHKYADLVFGLLVVVLFFGLPGLLCVMHMRGWF